jgi:hypothetical protein
MFMVRSLDSGRYQEFDSAAQPDLLIVPTSIVEA